MEENPTPADYSESSPDFAQRQAQIFDHWIESGRYDKAVEAGKLALAESPEDGYLHSQMGFVYYQLDQTKLAKHHLETALASDPEDPYPRSLLTLINSGGLVSSFSKVEQEALNTLRLNPEDYNAWFVLAHHTITYDETFSLNCCDRLIQLTPENAHPYLTKARLLTVCEEPRITEAKNLIEQALRLEPNYEYAHETAAWFFLNEEKDRTRGKEHLNTILEINPSNTEAIAMLTEIRVKKNWIVRILNLPQTLAKCLYAIVSKWAEFHTIIWIFTWPLVLFFGLMGLWISAMWFIIFFPAKFFFEWLVLRADEARWIVPEWLTPIFRLPKCLQCLIWLAFTVIYFYSMHYIFTHDEFKAGEKIYFTIVYGILWIGLPLLGIWCLSEWVKKRRIKKQLPNTLKN